MHYTDATKTLPRRFAGGNNALAYATPKAQQTLLQFVSHYAPATKRFAAGPWTTPYIL